jgi:hypothetical protein
MRTPYDFTRFTKLMDDLQNWRDADHEDTIGLGRSWIICIIEGVKAMQEEKVLLRQELEQLRYMNAHLEQMVRSEPR